MSQQADAPGRGCISSFTPPVREIDLLEAEAMQTLVLLNTVTYPSDPVHDILYRSFDREYDITHHVFRWDTTPYQQVFANGFHARRQENVGDEVYCNLEQYVNGGGRPLDSTRPATYCFVSTTIDSGWYPSVRPEQGVVVVTRYEIYAPGGIWVAETLGDRYRFPAQDEVAFVNGIAPQYIRSAQLFRLQASGRHTRRERVNNILYINGGFNPQLFYADERMPQIQRPIKLYQNPDTKQMENLITQIWNPPHMIRKRETSIRYVNYKALVDDGIVIDAAFRSSRKDEVYVFMKNEYALINYAPGSTNDRVVNGPHLICDSFPSLGGTAFAEHGIDCAFTTHYRNECFIFSGNLCAKIDYAPGTKNDKILKGPMSIFKMFSFLKGTVFETGVDAAFESSTKDEAYLFKGNKYALINYSDNKPRLFHIKDIGEGYPSLKGTIFDKGIDAAFASHRSNEAYIFKGDTYALINFAPASSNDYIVNGPKKIFPNWPSLKSILPRPNDGLDVHDHAIEVPGRVHDEL
ncbi:putative Hemopexin-like domain superfamily [Helianthus annuus]|nr:putative Hemopexin-like domain superfamily [Helianthus annuus]